MAFRLSYHDLASRATEAIPRERLARAIEQLSAAYREGRTVHHERSREARAAYLVHTLPAHVCDVKRLLLDELASELRREDLRVLALGAGPGTRPSRSPTRGRRSPRPTALLRGSSST